MPLKNINIIHMNKFLTLYISTVTKITAVYGIVNILLRKIILLGKEIECFNVAALIV